MKPLRILLEAFGPFPAAQWVDFRDLGARTLFLISGPTGSGKTSVLDGICFALYGQATGADRQVKSLRSDHAAPSLPTRVVFDFELAGSLYRIERSPKQERPKKRGTGTTPQAAGATLWQHDGPVLDDSPPTHVLATGWGDVSAKAAELLGFEASQFRQVVILPQGEFRRFLASDTKARAEILSTLFETQRYHELQHLLKARKLAIESQLHDSKVKRKAILDKMQVTSPTELETKRAAQALQLTQLEAQVNQLAAAAQAAKAQLDAGRACQAKLDELSAARAALAAIQAGESRIELQRAELNAARSATEIAGYETHSADRGRELADAKRERTTSQELVRLATQAHTTTQAELEAQLARADELEAARERRSDLHSKAELAQQLDNARSAAAQAQRQLRAAERAVAQGETHEAKSEADYQAARERAQRARSLADGLGAARVAAKAAADTLRGRRDLTQRQSEQQRATTARDAAQAALQTANEALTASQRRLVSLNRARLAGQASRLAAGLERGQPCPVCGSPEHPAPAAPRPDMPSDADLEAGEAAITTATNQRDERQAAMSRASNALSAVDSRIAGLREQLGDAAATALAALEQDSSAAQQALELAQQASASLQQQSNRAAQLQQAHADAGTALAAAREAHAEAVGADASARQAVQSAEQGLSVELRPPGALERATRNAEAIVHDMVAALEAARSAAEAAGNKLTDTTARLEQTIVALELAEQRAADAAVELAKRIAEAGFADVAAYAHAKRDADVTAQLERAIKAWEHALADTSGRLERATTAAEGLEAPDLPALEAAEASAREAHATQREQLGSARSILAELVATLAELARIAAAQADEEAQLTVVGRLANVATGSNSARLSFERFVLASLLDQVLLAANTRLSVMSSGRYSLRRTDIVADRRSHAGLDLEVLDAHTGRARPVSTLSGGEGFEASLALALGLADTVQARSGGIHLDAVFVDEGFGSLGQEDLDAVLQSLQDLQVGGRLVGIISHVAELRERITTRLELTKGRGGSSARFVVP